MSMESFIYKGIKDFVIRDKVTKQVVCNVRNMVNIKLSDETAQDYLRGGYNNPKLLTISGDRDCKLECSTATNATELIKVMTNKAVVVKTKPQLKIETPSIAGGKFTLALIPSIGIAPTIFKLDADGKEVKPALVVGSPATNATDYSIAGKDITCNAAVTKIRVYYDADVEVDTIEATDNTPKNYEIAGLLVAQEVETSKIFEAWIDCPNATIQPTFSFQANNDTKVPDAVTLNIDLLMDMAKGYPYSLSFKREAE